MSVMEAGWSELLDTHLVSVSQRMYLGMRFCGRACMSMITLGFGIIHKLISFCVAVSIIKAGFARVS